MKKIRTILIIFFLLKISSFSYAWGKIGHNIIAEITKQCLKQSIQDSVQKYLGTMTWESASTWMDDIKSNSEYDYMKTWHYINIEKGKTYDTTASDSNNIVYQLQKAILKLRNKSKLSSDEITLNLKILFHLIGDLYQPLHVGYASDRGGNNIKVTFNGQSKNLHQIWDRDIIEYKNITYENELKLYTKLSSDSISKIKNTSVTDWLTQSQSLLDNVYSYKSTSLDEDYINKSSIIIENQLLSSGLNLASLLEETFQ